MAVGEAGEGVGVDMGLAEDGERLAAGDIARTRSNTSFVVSHATGGLADGY